MPETVDEPEAVEEPEAVDEPAGDPTSPEGDDGTAVRDEFCMLPDRIGIPDGKEVDV